MAAKPGSVPEVAPPVARGREKQLAPGIYFTPAPSSVSHLSHADNPDGLPTPPNVNDMTRHELETEYRAISKSVEKLEESNALMTEFDPEGNDAELVDAIRENKAIVVRKKTRMISVKARLAYLIRLQSNLKDSRQNETNAAVGTTPTPTEDSPEQGLHL